MAPEWVDFGPTPTGHLGDGGLVEQIIGGGGVLPWAAWAVLVAGAVAVLAARPLAVWLESSPLVSGLLVFGAGIVIAVTLTPVNAAGSSAWRSFGTDSALVPDWVVSDRFANLLLFVPLGLAAGLVGRADLRRWVVLAVLLSPLLVEGMQAVLPLLNRGPQWQDVLDNTIGILVGLGAAWVIRRRSAPVRVDA